MKFTKAFLLLTAIITGVSCTTELKRTSAQDNMKVYLASGGSLSGKVGKKLRLDPVDFSRGMPKIVHHFKEGGLTFDMYGQTVLANTKEILNKNGYHGLLIDYFFSDLGASLSAYSFKYEKPSDAELIENIDVLFSENQRKFTTNEEGRLKIEQAYWSFQYALSQNNTSLFDHAGRIYTEYLNQVRLYNKGKCQGISRNSIRESGAIITNTVCDKAPQLAKYVVWCESYLISVAKILADRNDLEPIKKQYELFLATTNRTDYENNMINQFNELLIRK